MFLETLRKEEESSAFLNTLNKKYLNIQKERDSIAELIEKEVDNNKSKKDIIDTVISKTNMTKNQIKNMIEEYSFNKKVDGAFNINEINHLKQFFKYNKITADSDIIKISQDSVHLESIFKETKFIEKNKKTRHTFAIDSDGEELYQEAQIIIEHILDRKVKTKGEVFYWLLVDFISNNSNYKEE